MEIFDEKPEEESEKESDDERGDSSGHRDHHHLGDLSSFDLKSESFLWSFDDDFKDKDHYIVALVGMGCDTLCHGNNHNFNCLDESEIWK